MREKVEEILRNLVAGIDVSSKALVDEGYVTSITMVQLISELDIAFDIDIAFDALVKENFQSVEAIEKMAESFRKKA